MLYLTLCYMVAGGLWIFANYKHKDNVVTVHKFITSVLIVSFFDYLFSYLDLDVYNEDGDRQLFLLITSSVFNVVKNTLARVLTLLVALGYGIRRSHVEEH